jgi:2,3-bisphosphoglycerate-independent phosphoglycerate mutase
MLITTLRFSDLYEIWLKYDVFCRHISPPDSVSDEPKLHGCCNFIHLIDHISHKSVKRKVDNAMLVKVGEWFIDIKELRSANYISSTFIAARISL